MAVGDGSLLGGLSYLSIGRETTFGTYTTCTTQVDFLSASLKTLKEAKILEQVSSSRTYKKQFQTGKVIEGEVEFYLYPRHTSSGFFLQNIFGGTVTTATSTGETIGGGALTHTFLVGSMDQSYTSLCLNMRKGDSTSGKIYEYSGARVNEVTFTAEIDEPLKASASFMIKDSTGTTNDVESTFSVNTTSCLSFVNGRLSVESTFGSLTSSSFWHIQSVEFGLGNSLKSGAEARRIGTDTVDVMPVGVASFPLSVTLRFDTSTAFDAMINETAYALELEFLGDTMSGSAIREGIKFQYPSVRVMDSGDPEIGGPDEILQATVVFNVLQDLSSASGYALRALLTNDITSYT